MIRRFETFTLHFASYGHFIKKEKISVSVARVEKEVAYFNVLPCIFQFNN